MYNISRTRANFNGVFGRSFLNLYSQPLFYTQPSFNHVIHHVQLYEGIQIHKPTCYIYTCLLPNVNTVGVKSLSIFQSGNYVGCL